MATRIAVDIGGTFTDLVYFDECSGETFEGKVPTTPDAPEEGVVAAIEHYVPHDVIANAEFFLHGTTVGLNALLERRGSKIGLITTTGFRDVLEIRRGDRAEMYNLIWKQTEPLVPRHRRKEINGRVLSSGAQRTPLDEHGASKIIAELMQEQVDAIAVCLINAYANPAHELQVDTLIRRAGFQGGISLSHKVSGEYREYERTSTTCIDAFVRVRMANYLQRLDQRLREFGFKGISLIARSGAGSMTFAQAQQRPFETIMSGPVGGAQGVSEMAQLLHERQLITADVGGTSFDTALIIDGAPQILFEGMIGNMPIQSPWVDVRSIGSGGGSIAHIDRGGLMRVGPQSAGAVPGPACYGKGGTQAAMTDAAAALGMLGSGKLASGITLDIEKAKNALQNIGQHIHCNVEQTAVGVMRIAASAMANAMREISLDQGLDPRAMTLLSFGGAGPLMGTLLADELLIKRIIIPPFAGNFSAWGLLGADMMQSASQTCVRDLTAHTLDTINQILEQLFSALAQQRAPHQQLPIQSARLDLRYKGQEHTLSIEIAVETGKIADSLEILVKRFVTEYARTFGATMNEHVELVAVRAQTSIPLPQRKNKRSASPIGDFEAREMAVYSFTHEKRMPFKLIPRECIAGDINGPAIITEDTCTTYVDVGWRITHGAHGELLLHREG